MSQPSKPVLDLASLLTILGDAVSKEVVTALDGTGLRHGHGYVIQRLIVGPATATEIAAELAITQQAVSKTIKELVRLGHVEMSADPADSRRRPARLTAQGHAAVARARAARTTVDERVRTALGRRRFDQLVGELSQILDVMNLRKDVERRAVQPPSPDLY